MAFDKNRPYGSVCGQHGAVYEQGGRFYTADGNEVIEVQEGEAVVPEPVDQVEPEPVDPAQPEDAAPRRGRKKAAQPEDAAPAGAQDSQLAAQLGESEEL